MAAFSSAQHLLQDGQELKPVGVEIVGVYLMSSVLSTLKEALSSLVQWRAAVDCSTSGVEGEESDHTPLENLLLPLACVVVLQTALPCTATGHSRYIELYTFYHIDSHACVKAD